MALPPLSSPVSTFVVRFWPERSPSGLHWRGRIEHVQSRESAAFCELQELLNFIQRFRIMADGSGCPVPNDT
jgi:hypothetical protein